jgi:hypothetical protein
LLSNDYSRCNAKFESKWANSFYYLFTRLITSESAVWPCLYLFYKARPRPNETLRDSTDFLTNFASQVNEIFDVETLNSVSLVDDETIHDALIQAYPNLDRKTRVLSTDTDNNDYQMKP